MAFDIMEEAGALLGRAVDWRRRLHAWPEIGLDLPRSQALVLAAVEEMGLPTSTGRATTSVVAVIEGTGPGPTTLLRADMDALPMPEDTGLPFASQVPGAMHACGHDAHTAMLLGAAHLLAARRRELAGRVVCIFQPGEEGHGGARVMLEEGLVEHHGPFDRAFALHVDPTLASGHVTTRPGTVMASADEFRVVVTGRGGHASMPHDAVDPMPAACEIVTALQVWVTRHVPAFDPSVVTVTRVVAGTAFNVIPETVTLEGTVRAVSEVTRERVWAGIRQVAEHVAASQSCSAEVTPVAQGYPVTVNDPGAAGLALEVGRHLLGGGAVPEMPSPLMVAEDWSYVLQRVPGAMAFLGVAAPGAGRPAPNHSNRMVLDEGAMAAGIAMHVAMALAPG
jgi:amidohydrolase